MPKANRHAEVKPSKYKTTLCQFYSRGEECPFAPRCAFAHGERELQTEQENAELLKSSGLSRLEPMFVAPEIPAGLAAIEATCPSSPVDTSASARRRRPVMVSLPKHSTTSDQHSSPYNPGYDDTRFTQVNRRDSPYHATTGSSWSRRFLEPFSAADSIRCHCDFSSTCRSEQPSVYRHNPYSLSGQFEL